MLVLKKFAFIGLAAIASLSAQANTSSSNAPSQQKMTLAEWQEMATQQASGSEKSLRISMVREAALSAAMRAGLANRSATINFMLEQNARYLDDTFDFPSLMLPDNVVPPVIQRVERITEQSGDILRFSAVNFRILKQAAFTTRPPTWRTYLTIPRWDDLGRTHATLLPRNAQEQQAAQEGLAEGWAAGQKQANQMFFIGLNRLNNDFIGMATYHALLQSNMVTLPKINRKDYPVLGEPNSMTIDQTTYAIESKPSFNPKMADWAALFNSGSDSPFSTELTEQPSKLVIEKASLPTLDSMRNEWRAN